MSTRSCGPRSTTAFEAKRCQVSARQGRADTTRSESYSAGTAIAIKQRRAFPAFADATALCSSAAGLDPAKVKVKARTSHADHGSPQPRHPLLFRSSQSWPQSWSTSRVDPRLQVLMCIGDSVAGTIRKYVDENRDSIDAVCVGSRGLGAFKRRVAHGNAPRRFRGIDGPADCLETSAAARAPRASAVGKTMLTAPDRGGMHAASDDADRRPPPRDTRRRPHAGSWRAWPMRLVPGWVQCRHSACKHGRRSQPASGFMRCCE